MSEFKNGSLFDGSGGFPLAASLCGGIPTWASEVEPYPIAVTRSRFRAMRHLGDISKINGAEVEPVDVITFGSPCQDLSVAGKRAGLKHEANGDDETTRSGLFMEAVRIIKEMRAASNGRYPTFALWENVPGAFSSNKGEDFRIVCEELIKIVEPTALMPAVPKAGWPYADCYIGDGWSLAYRVFDAQYWGVPQRRRRIHLVLDLRGERAGAVLFEREGLRGYFAEGGTPWQGIAADAERSTGADDRAGEGGVAIVKSVPYTLKIRSGCEGGGKGALIQTDLSATLATNNDQYLFQPVPVAESHGNVPCVVEVAGFKAGNGAKANGIGYQEEIAPTLSAAPSGTNQVPSVCYRMGSFGQYVEGEAEPLKASGGDIGGGSEVLCVEPIPIHDKATRYKGGGPTRNGDGAANGLGIGKPGDPHPTLTAGDRHAVAYSNDVQYIVRRLTPTECARLQGFPDTWGHPDIKDDLTDEEYTFWQEVRNTHAAINGKAVKDYTKAQMLTWYNKLHTDSAEYKMWGNGIALPPALYCMQGIAEALAEEERV